MSPPPKNAEKPNQDKVDNPSQYLADHNGDKRTSWYGRNIKPIVNSVGEAASDFSVAIMASGLGIGILRTVCRKEYSNLARNVVKSSPTGRLVFFAGLTLGIIGESMRDQRSFLNKQCFKDLQRNLENSNLYEQIIIRKHYFFKDSKPQQK